MLGLSFCSKTHQTTVSESEEMVGDIGLGTLPYDLLLNIAFYLDLYDIHALHLVSNFLSSLQPKKTLAFSPRHLGLYMMPQRLAQYTAN